MDSKSKTVYLAGKITGDPSYRMKFMEAARALEGAGFAVVNPATLPSRGFSYEAYMRMSGAMLAECEAACFLPDWKDSHGAIYEHGFAAANGIDIFYFAEWLEAHEILSNEKTGKLAFRCFMCEKISVYSASRGDGRTCAHCGGHIAPIGFAKVGVKLNA